MSDDFFSILLRLKRELEQRNIGSTVFHGAAEDTEFRVPYMEWRERIFRCEGSLAVVVSGSSRSFWNSAAGRKHCSKAQGMTRVASDRSKCLLQRQGLALVTCLPDLMMLYY